MKAEMLEQELELELARNWHQRGCERSLHRLVNAYMRLAVSMASKYVKYGIDTNELIQEAGIGLMKAAEKFDPERGVRFSTYATWWIKASIQEYILHSWSLVKIGTTAAQKKLFFNLRKLKGQMQAIDDGDLSPETITAIAARLDVSEKDVVSMNGRLSGPDHSLNAPKIVDGDGEWQDWLEDEGKNQEQILAETEELGARTKLLNEAMEKLDSRERHILSQRRLIDTPKTLDELSKEYSVSRERIRQIEARAFEKLQKHIKELAINNNLWPE
jgi:RNA polymerase sigma-32 factor